MRLIHTTWATRGKVRTSMHSIQVFSVSTKIASILRPRTTETAKSYLRALGLHKSTNRPRTPIRGYQWAELHLTLTLTRKDTLEILKVILEATVSLGFPLFRAGLKKLTMYILQLLVDLAFKFADNEVRKRLSRIKPRTIFWSVLPHSSPSFASRS
jgi:hypothetical protein